MYLRFQKYKKTKRSQPSSAQITWKTASSGSSFHILTADSFGEDESFLDILPVGTLSHPSSSCKKGEKDEEDEESKSR